jgi:hypothetical protein
MAAKRCVLQRTFYIHVMADSDVYTVKTHARMLNVQPSVIVHVLSKKATNVLIICYLRLNIDSLSTLPRPSLFR